MNQEIKDKHRELSNQYFSLKREYDSLSKSARDASYCVGLHRRDNPKDKEKLHCLLQELYLAEKKSSECWRKLCEIKHQKLEIEWNNNDKFIGYLDVYKTLCKYCGEVFFSNNKRQKYCCNTHLEYFFRDRKRERRHKSLEDRQCVVCSNVFKEKRKDMIYCSKACKQLAYRKRNKVE